METQQIALSCDDDCYIALLLNDSENLEGDQTLMSDEKCAEELQLQEAIMASYITLQSHNSGNDSAPGKGSRGVGESSGKDSREVGESSEKDSREVGESSQPLCEICAERKDIGEMFPVQSCTHQFCTECITKHISIKIQKRTVVNHERFTCPGSDCKGVLEIDTCREIVPKDVLSMWDEAICESMIVPSQKFYCPYKSCSALLVNDSDQEVIKEAECPFCRRLFCVQCHVPWHAGVDCEEFSKLSENERGREDLLVHELAKLNKWQRCPRCKFFVEKNQGCLHMTCRCGFQFCYACGAVWSSTHGGCQ
ncbi:hypothetical protein Pfo_020169 [Paulownia fortunei]|nr:hypothetical protein Pfo_020169 [Paulownia fortunei]